MSLTRRGARGPAPTPPTTFEITDEPVDPDADFDATGMFPPAQRRRRRLAADSNSVAPTTPPVEVADDDDDTDEDDVEAPDAYGSAFDAAAAPEAPAATGGLAS